MPKPKTTAPRASLVDPDRFGEPGDAEWHQPDSADAYVALRAAELQHHVAIEIGDRLRHDGRTNEWLEQRAGLAAGRVRKLRRGHAQMTFRDLQAIEGCLGPVVLRINFARAEVHNPAVRAQFPADTLRWGT